MGMNIVNPKPGLLIKQGTKNCPRCGHRAIYHVTDHGALVSELSPQTKLAACFITGCTGCAEYKGEA